MSPPTQANKAEGSLAKKGATDPKMFEGRAINQKRKGGL
jgi:hypothetical protein